MQPQFENEPRFRIKSNVETEPENKHETETNCDIEPQISPQIQSSSHFAPKLDIEPQNKKENENNLVGGNTYTILLLLVATGLFLYAARHIYNNESQN